MRDGLTGLPERHTLQRRLSELVTRAGKSELPVALLLIDLNRFEEINHGLGHEYGDLLLQQVASRLRAVSREGDLIGRVGDDEFALILPNTTMAAAMGCIRKVQSALRAPFVVLGARLNVRARVGAALSPQHATEPDLLYTRADTA
ncbi:MAG TPA: GGDEF domain-containing protein, partial [Chloroflexota bacterium]